MNLVLFEAHELTSGLPESDARVRHVRDVLRRSDGGEFDAGVVNGHRGKARLVTGQAGVVTIEFRPTDAGSVLFPVEVIVGLSRPQTCRSLLRSLTSLGVRSIEFVRSDRGEASYASSKLWTTGEWRTQVVAAACQAFDTALPQVQVGRSLTEALGDAPKSRIALDNYAPTTTIKSTLTGSAPVALVIGSERGWSEAEREVLRAHHCELASLGPRVLRVEVAAVAAVAAVLSERAWTLATPTPSTR